MYLLALAAKPVHHITTHDTWHAFVTRLESNHLRLVICIIVLLVVASVLWHKNPFLGALSGIGSGWFMWYLYNSVTGWRTPLFIGEHRPSQLWSLLFGSGWSFLAAVIGLLLGFGAFHLAKGSNIVIRSLAGIGTWAATLLVYTIVFQEWLHWV